MKKIFALLVACIPLLVIAQSDNEMEIYLKKGAVPVKNGVVIFEKEFKAQGKSKQQIYDSLLVFTMNIIESEDQLPQSRITKADPATGTITANFEENLYFKRKAWVTDYTRFYYQLIFHCKDGGYTATMHHIRYQYEEDRNYNNGHPINAEDWITDEEAINKKGKLSRVSGKFRKGTIDRKNELFDKSYSAVTGKKRIKRIIFVDEDN